MAKSRRTSSKTKPRWTIGLHGLLGLFWVRTEMAAREFGVNQVGFECQRLGSPVGFDALANVLTELTSPENVDGLVIWSDYIGHYISAQEMQVFCERFSASLPVVSIGAVEGIPSVIVDNYQGVYDMMVHLIQVHRHERIACIRGPEGNVEADERYRAYVDALADHEIPFDPELVVLGDFDRASAEPALHELLAREVAFDVVMAPTDEVAMALIELLHAKGIQVPQDVAVVGFDDEGKDYIPPLTSVHARWDEAGAKAMQIVLAMLQGEEVTERLVLPSKLVVRQSCGCPSPAMAQAVVGHVPEVTGQPEETLTICRQRTVSAVQQALSGIDSDSFLVSAGYFATRQMPSSDKPLSSLVQTWTQQLLDAFLTDLAGETATGRFHNTLQGMLRQVVRTNGDVEMWQGAL